MPGLVQGLFFFSSTSIPLVRSSGHTYHCVISNAFVAFANFTQIRWVIRISHSSRKAELLRPSSHWHKLRWLQLVSILGLWVRGLIGQYVTRWCCVVGEVCLPTSLQFWKPQVESRWFGLSILHSSCISSLVCSLSTYAMLSWRCVMQRSFVVMLFMTSFSLFFGMNRFPSPHRSFKMGAFDSLTRKHRSHTLSKK